MEWKLENLTIVGMTIILVMGFFAASAQAQENDVNRTENYKALLGEADQIIKDIRLGRDISQDSIDDLQDAYTTTFPDSSGDILTSIRNLTPSDVSVEEVKDIRAAIVEKGNSEGLKLSFLYQYSHFVILGVSFLLAIVVNFINRVAVDWEEVNRVRAKQEKLQEKVKEARENNETKKAHKLQQKQQDFMQEHMGVMFSPMKTMIFIFIPFIIVFNLLSSTYSGWVVAWLPFKLPWPEIGFPLLNRFFKGNVAGLGYFGWYILSYFGFAQFWRKILVPQR